MNAKRDIQSARMSCILPVFNESAHLASFVSDLYRTLSNLTHSVELIIINDGSVDQTHTVITQLLEKYPIRFINFSRNFGKEAAITAGLNAADGDVVLLMDSDYQHPISLIPEMIAKWQSGVDMVYGVIEDRSEESTIKKLGTNVLYKLINLNLDNRFQIPKHAGDFRLMDRQVVMALRQLPERNRFMKGLYAWVGFTTEPLYFTPDKRPSGESSYGYRRLAHLAINGITAFSTFPLYVSVLIGVVISMFAIAYGIYILFETGLHCSSVPGWATLVVALMFFSGLQFILIGVLGKYIGQIFEEVKSRPLYIVESVQHSPLFERTLSAADLEPDSKQS